MAAISKTSSNRREEFEANRDLQAGVPGSDILLQSGFPSRTHLKNHDSSIHGCAGRACNEAQSPERCALGS